MALVAYSASQFAGSLLGGAPGAALGQPSTAAPPASTAAAAAVAAAPSVVTNASTVSASAATATATATAAATATSSVASDDMHRFDSNPAFQRFVANVRTRGYFDDVEEGSDGEWAHTLTGVPCVRGRVLGVFCTRSVDLLGAADGGLRADCVVLCCVVVCCGVLCCVVVCCVVFMVVFMVVFWYP